ncbi:unnamed protein product [Urochloa humidicola]
MPRARLSSIFASAATYSSKPPSQPPRAAAASALAAATKRVSAGTFSRDDAHHIFDELLSQATVVPERELNGLLVALARAPPSATCRDGPALAIALFNRISRSTGPRVVPTTVCTYSILMDCCCRARRPDLVLAFFGRILRLGLQLDVFTFNNLLKGLCQAKRTNEALDMLLCLLWTPGLDSAHDVISFSIVINGFFKEGKVEKACNLFHQMIQRGVPPDVVTYNIVIDALCKARAMDKAERVLRQMINDGVPPNIRTYTILTHGYSTLGQWKNAVRIFTEMTSRGFLPDAAMWNSFMASLCRHGRIKEARNIFDSMALKGQKPDVVSYRVMLHGYATEGCFDEMTDLFKSTTTTTTTTTTT